MIPVGALARMILGFALDDAKEVVTRETKKAIIRAEQRKQLRAAKELIAEQVANAYTTQVKELAEGYIEAVQDATAELSFVEDEDKKLSLAAENALRKLEIYIEGQSPDGPVIKYLQERYEEEGIRRISGKLYASHYILRKSQGIYSIYNRMAYAPLVDKNKPWLSSDKTSQGIGDIIAEKAEQLFQEAFDIDFSEEQVKRI